MAEMITRFDGEHEFLSNFHEASFWMPTARFVWKPPPSCPDRWWFNSAEHAFQAAKATTHDEAIRVVNAPSPYQAKRTGRVVTCRQDWDAIKRTVMLEVLLAKFTCLGHLGDQLRVTGTAVLVEGNTWGDDYWGAVRGGKPPAWHWGSGWYGDNWLGRLLMMVREVL